MSGVMQGWHGVVAAALLLGGGCGGEPDAPLASAIAAGLRAVEAPLAHLEAAGTGCPEGTWSAEVAPDGSSVSFELDAFAGVVGPRRLRDARRCVLSLRMRDDGLGHAPLQVAVGGSGGPVRYTARAYWVGGEGEAKLEAGESAGALDFVMNTANLPSSCGGLRELRVELEATAERSATWPDEPTRAFYFDRVRIDLAERACAQGGDASVGAEGDGGVPVSPSEVVVKAIHSASCTDAPARVTLHDHGFSLHTALTVDGPERKRCDLDAEIEAPPGKTLAVEKIPVRGTSSLAAGAFATVSVVADWVAQRGAASQQKRSVEGPFDGPFSLAEGFDASALFFRDCGRASRPLRVVVGLSTAGPPDVDDARGRARATITEIGPVSFAVRDCPAAHTSGTAEPAPGSE